MITLETLGEVRLSTGTPRLDGAPATIAIDSANTATAFAAFAHRRGATVTVQDLVEAMWRGRPTRTARQGVHVQISRMRKLLAGLGCDGAEAIVKVAGGYRLNGDLVVTDVVLFEQYAQCGHVAQRTGAFQDALRFYDSALALWHGEPMAGLSVGPGLGRLRDALSKLHLEVRGARAEVLIRLGAGREVISEFQELVELDPYQELLHAGLMIALSRSGRRGEALRVYRTLACRLNSELGIRPDPRIHALFRAVADGAEYRVAEIYSAEATALPGAN
ncbi:hypothetical protein DW322_20930 [Rhodococcus rhodnii]|uniref:EmbR family transcriptional regulator n=2 Tax=Rhodococcus rhodnii TaxID=38312 RepID=R7WMN4_9NOCA|nr:BTAD domain-containing putative transcriptional regulator [Rhodococcus rhodnii]EOM76581.1 EmbR family transcriptional regulator [Rhodococcus rhodnii LMG 5362]TXG92185.1 hypothetical protein DW322_20930 [Rhodococcus rhodnii]